MAGALDDGDAVANREWTARGAASAAAVPVAAPPHRRRGEALATATATPRPWQRITNPVKAMAYFRAVPRNRLAWAYGARHGRNIGYSARPLSRSSDFRIPQHASKKIKLTNK